DPRFLPVLFSGTDEAAELRPAALYAGGFVDRALSGAVAEGRDCAPRLGDANGAGLARLGWHRRGGRLGCGRPRIPGGGSSRADTAGLAVMDPSWRTAG